MSGDYGDMGCVVTGVAGFVGSHLAEQLLALNCRVVGVDNFFSGHRSNLAHLQDHPAFTFYERSVVEFRLLADLKGRHPELNRCFHLAAIVSVPYSVDHPEETMRVNHEAAVDLLKEAEKLGFGVFVFAGSAAEYGDDQRLPLREEFATEATRHLSPYGRAKFLASKRVGSSPCGVALRFFNIYGPRQDPKSPYSGVISRFMEMAVSGKPLTVFGDGRQTRDFIYVLDVVEAYLHAAGLKGSRTIQPQGIYNIGTGKKTTILDLAETIQKLAGNMKPQIFSPERPGDIRHSLATVDAFRNATDWEPKVSLEEGLMKTLEWTREF